MKAFMVSVNGRHVCTAGIGPNGVLSTMLTWVGGGPRRDPEGAFHFSVGGLDSRTDEHVDWTTPELAVGDEVTVRVVEVEQIDPEVSRRKAQRDGEGGG
jgi:hypothetical protein